MPAAPLTRLVSSVGISVDSRTSGVHSGIIHAATIHAGEPDAVGRDCLRFDFLLGGLICIGGFRRGLTPPLSVASSFQLPDPQGRAGGACTAALLQVLYDGDTPQDRGASWVDVLRQSEFREAEEGTRTRGSPDSVPGGVELSLWFSHHLSLSLSRIGP